MLFYTDIAPFLGSSLFFFISEDVAPDINVSLALDSSGRPGMCLAAIVLQK